MRKVLFFCLGIMFSGVSLLGAEDKLPTQEKKKSNKIVYLISPPRCLSVVFTRMMKERGDHEIFHEPSIYAYIHLYFPEYTKKRYKEDSYATYEEAKTALYMAAAKKPVFAKEMSFAIEGFIENDLDFIKDENVQFVFLMRNPHHSIISFYKKQIDIPPLLIGFKQMNNIFQLVKKYSKNKPIIISTEDLYTNPEGTIKAFCSAVDIPFLPDSLHWSNLGSEFDGADEWHELKFKEFVQHWHGEAIKSTGFAKPTQYDVDAQGKPTFIETSNEKDREECSRAYLYNLPFYESLKNEKEYYLVPE